MIIVEGTLWDVILHIQETATRERLETPPEIESLLDESELFNMYCKIMFDFQEANTSMSVQIELGNIKLAFQGSYPEFQDLLITIGKESSLLDQITSYMKARELS